MPDTLAARRRRDLPELAAGGYSRLNGTVEFYLRVHALLDEHATSTVVDLGAGRGHWFEHAPAAIDRRLRDLRAPGRTVVGIDVDDAVLAHPGLDAAHVVVPPAALPLDDASVDVVVSDYTFEHVEDPAWVAGELHRVLRPGGWICARTPNRWGAIAMPARMVPNRLHDAVLARVQPTKDARDTFPTHYRLNTAAALRRWFPRERFAHCGYTHESEPAYAGRSALAWTAFRRLAAITPPPVRSMRFVFLQKVGDQA
ncbi:class I SAM-dependent methyltransferase [Actinomycetospora sp. C-140]